MDRTRVSSGAHWEPKLGYCRAVRAGSQIFVSGTIAIDAEGNIVGPGDPYLQAMHILRIIEHALEAFARTAGATLHLAGTGRNDHHLAEAAFKALGRALRVACEPDPRRVGVASTKGALG